MRKKDTWRNPARSSNGGRPISSTERISKERAAWVRLPFHEFVMYEYEGMDEDVKEQLGNNITISLRLANQVRPIRISLTGMTVQELTAMRDFLELAINTAMPISQMRDEEAENAFQRGDDTWARHYRAPAQFIVRERAQREHSERIRLGPEGVSEVDGVGVSEPVAIDGDLSGDNGSTVAEQIPENSFPQDHGTQTHFFTRPSEVPGAANGTE